MRKNLMIAGTMILCTLAGARAGVVLGTQEASHHPMHSCMDIMPLFIWTFSVVLFTGIGLLTGICLSSAATLLMRLRRVPERKGGE